MNRLRSLLQRPATAIVLLLLALGVWGIMLRTHSSSSGKRREAGFAYLQQGRGADAEREWRAALHDNPNDSQTYAYLTEYYTATKNWPAALETAKQIARLHPDAPHINALLAKCALYSGDERAAYAYMETALRSDPSDAETLALFATLLAKTGEEQRRLKVLTQLASLRPDDTALALQLIEAQVSKRLYADSLPRIEQILKQDPANVEAHALRGIVLYNQDPSPKGSKQAEEDFLLAVKTPHFAPSAHFYLGKIYDRLGKPALAIPHLESAAQALPNKREIFFALAEACKQVGDTQKAESAQRQFAMLREMESRIDTLTSQCAADQTNFEKRMELATLLERHGDLERAAMQLTRAQELRPNDPQVLSALKEVAEKTQSGPTSLDTAGR